MLLRSLVNLVICLSLEALVFFSKDNADFVFDSSLLSIETFLESSNVPVTCFLGTVVLLPLLVVGDFLPILSFITPVTFLLGIAVLLTLLVVSGFLPIPFFITPVTCFLGIVVVLALLVVSGFSLIVSSNILSACFLGIEVLLILLVVSGFCLLLTMTLLTLLCAITLGEKMKNEIRVEKLTQDIIL